VANEKASKQTEHQAKARK